MDPLRIDILLHRLCLTRSRSEAKAACQAGAVSIGGATVAASRMVRIGDSVRMKFASRVLEFELLEMPGKATSKKTTREMYRVTRDESVIAG